MVYSLAADASTEHGWWIRFEAHGFVIGPKPANIRHGFGAWLWGMDSFWFLVL